MMTALSCPRTHRGTNTRSVRTLASPSVFSVVTAHWTARFRFSEPDRRLP
jgi:hypothetical protein